jgi:hypothetical protein
MPTVGQKALCVSEAVRPLEHCAAVIFVHLIGDGANRAGAQRDEFGQDGSASIGEFEHGGASVGGRDAAGDQARVGETVAEAAGDRGQQVHVVTQRGDQARSSTVEGLQGPQWCQADPFLQVLEYGDTEFEQSAGSLPSITAYVGVGSLAPHAARSSIKIGECWATASKHCPSPRVNCSSS